MTTYSLFHLSLMGCRYEWLQWLVRGYEKTGAALIGFNGTQLVPWYAGDDIGIYYCIPQLVRWLSISLDHGIFLFFYGIAALSFVLGIGGFFALYTRWSERCVALIGLGALLHATLLTDVYVAYSASAMSVVPLSLYYLQKKEFSYRMATWLFLSGLIVGFAHYIRSFSSLGVICFMVGSIVLNKRFERMHKACMTGCLVVGMLLVGLFFRGVYSRYGVDAQRFVPDQSISISKHVVWHALYLGFGFLSNEHGIRWDDTCGLDRVKSIDPSVEYCSPAYENVLRQEVVRLCKDHPSFVLKTLFAKMGILLYYLFIFANIGLLLAAFYRKPWQMDTAFLVAFVASGSFGVLVMPLKWYLLGFIAFAVLFGIVSIDYALEHGLIRDVKKCLALRYARFSPIQAYKAPIGNLVMYGSKIRNLCSAWGKKQ